MIVAVDRGTGKVLGQLLEGFPGEEKQGLLRVLTAAGGRWVLAASVRLEKVS